MSVLPMVIFPIHDLALQVVEGVSYIMDVVRVSRYCDAASEMNDHVINVLNVCDAHPS